MLDFYGNAGGKSDVKRLWRTSKSGPALEDSGDGTNAPVCSVLVSQAWTSQSSLREGPSAPEEDVVHHPDSGIDSNQASPTPAPQSPDAASPSATNRKSRSLLHPDHARTMSLRPPTPDRRSSLEDPNSGFATSISSSAASSTTSIAAATISRTSDPLEIRRGSTITARYSLLDALDLEYALMRAAGRGSIGPYSLSQSLQKLSFTQSLAFPALARGLADKRGKSEKSPRLDPIDSGVNAFAKVATALVLVLVSVLVFGFVYKFVRT